MEIWPYDAIHKILWYFEIQTDHLISARRPGLMIVNKKRKEKKRTCWIVDFGVPAYHSVKLKEIEKRDKYLDLAREQKKLWNMKVTVIPNVICALSTVNKGLVQALKDLEIKGLVETIQNTALLRFVRILRRVLETSCHTEHSGKPTANASGKNSQLSERINNQSHNKRMHQTSTESIKLDMTVWARGSTGNCARN